MRISIIALLCLVMSTANAQIKRDSLYYFKKAEQGVVLPQNATWVNALKTFSVFDVPDRFVAIHIWNPADVNSHASVLEMNRLQEEYPYMLVVSVIDEINSALLSKEDVEFLVGKYRINHPVILAEDHEGLKRNPKERLPVVKVVRNDAEVYGVFEGEEGIDDLEVQMASMSEGQIEVLGVRTDEFQSSPTMSNIRRAMSYPTAIQASNKYGEWYVTDTNNNRILIVDSDGQINEVIGSGVEGDRDGKWGACQFNQPTDLALDDAKDLLYVSDTHNHKVKVIDLKNKTVKSILGNGTRAYKPETRIDSTSGPISFPKGLLLKESKLVVAMAGHNQLWSYDVNVKSALPKVLDETISNLTSPNQLASDVDGNIYVTDNSKTGLQKITLTNKVEQVNVFATDSASMQYGLEDVLVAGEKMYLTQPLKHRVLQFEDGKLTVVAGGEAGSEDGKKGSLTSFNYPSGIGFSGDNLIVVDQGNMSLRSVSPKKGKTSTVRFTRFDKLFRNIEAFNEGDRVFLEPIVIGRGMNSVYVQFDLDEKYTWLSDGRNEVFMERAGMNTLISGSPSRGFVETEVPGSEMNLYISLQLYCTIQDKETKEVYFRPLVLVVPLEYDPNGKISHDLKWNPFEELD